MLFGVVGIQDKKLLCDLRQVSQELNRRIEVIEEAGDMENIEWAQRCDISYIIADKGDTGQVPALPWGPNPSQSWCFDYRLRSRQGGAGNSSRRGTEGSCKSEPRGAGTY